MTVFRHQTMGTVVSLDIRDPGADELAQEAFGLFDRADATFSTFRPDSELMRLARGELAPEEASAEVREVLALGDSFERASGGAFTIHRGAGLDANGIVKGWTAHAAARLLADNGVHDFCLNAGGDLICHGRPETGRRWQAGIRDPRDAKALLGVVVLDEAAMATSGSYERGAHIIDGRTAAAPQHWTSVTVIDADLTIADILATTVFAMGADGPAWAREEFGSAIITLDTHGVLDVLGSVRWAQA